MKKTFLTLAAIYTIGTVNHVKAQVAMNQGKDVTSFIAETPNDINSGVSNMNVRAVKNFKKEFATAENEIWAKKNDGFIVSFSQEDIQNRVAYDKKGNWIYTIRSYNENNLPAAVRAIVKTTYYDYTITRVAEVHVNDHVSYLVHLADATTVKIVRVYDEEIKVVESYVKG